MIPSQKIYADDEKLQTNWTLILLYNHHYVQEHAMPICQCKEHTIFGYTHLLSDYQECQIFTQIHNAKSAFYMELYQLV